jgi:predicted transposase/invertase (TIGR01784 family)
MQYLDPKNDLTFRKIFGQRPHLLISFLNSILPLEDGRLIERIEYTDIEMLPELPGFKRSIVDVNCTDNTGRMFIVEMQMYWTSSFKQRMLFNAGKAYVRQLKDGGKYRALMPVYGLSLVDDIFHKEPEFKNMYYHHYRMVHAQDSSKHIEGIELIFVELPKFKAQNFTDKRLQTLWLRFLTEINEDTNEVSEDLLKEDAIKEALDCVHKDAFTPEELAYYDKYWDVIRVDKAAIEDLTELNKALTLQKEEERKQKEEAIKREEEERTQKEEAIFSLARKMLKYNESIADIIKETGLTEQQIKEL